MKNDNFWDMASLVSHLKVQAEKRGLKYQTYLKMLIHEALGREKAKARR